MTTKDSRLQLTKSGLAYRTVRCVGAALLFCGLQAIGSVSMGDGGKLEIERVKPALLSKKYIKEEVSPRQDLCETIEHGEHVNIRVKGHSITIGKDGGGCSVNGLVTCQVLKPTSKLDGFICSKSGIKTTEIGFDGTPKGFAADICDVSLPKSLRSGPNDRDHSVSFRGNSFVIEKRRDRDSDVRRRLEQCEAKGDFASNGRCLNPKFYEFGAICEDGKELMPFKTMDGKNYGPESDFQKWKPSNEALSKTTEGIKSYLSERNKKLLCLDQGSFMVKIIDDLWAKAEFHKDRYIKQLTWYPGQTAPQDITDGKSKELRRDYFDAEGHHYKTQSAKADSIPEAVLFPHDKHLSRIDENFEIYQACCSNEVCAGAFRAGESQKSDGGTVKKGVQ